jgi:capsular polysaccharide biosynthesis protein
MNNFFDNQRILSVIWNRKFHFMVIGIVAILLSAIFSGPTFIKPKYKSTARIYPSNLGEMSEESNTEQMLEIVNSNKVKFRIFEAFYMKDIFNVPKNDPHYLTYTFDIYNENIKTTKTPNETVEIKVLAYNPQVASDMCDSIIHFYNETVGTMYRAKNLELVEISKKQLDKKYAEADSLIALINKIRLESGVVGVYVQSPEITRGYIKALIEGRESATQSDIDRVKTLYQNILINGAEAQKLEVAFNNILDEIGKIKVIYDLNLNEYQKVITYSHIVEKPFAADDKSYPVRWLIVAFATFSAVFLALLVFLVLDYRREE